jgi:hypothetical protein
MGAKEWEERERRAGRLMTSKNSYARSSGRSGGGRYRVDQQNDSREVVPPGKMNPSWHHMVPIANFLIERGHPPINYAERSGFTGTRYGMKCRLGYWISEADCVAINEAFVVPPNIQYYQGLIRDNVNRVDITGHEEVTCEDGVQPVSVWADRERRAGRL